MSRAIATSVADTYSIDSNLAARITLEIEHAIPANVPTEQLQQALAEEYTHILAAAGYEHVPLDQVIETVTGHHGLAARGERPG